MIFVTDSCKEGTPRMFGAPSPPVISDETAVVDDNLSDENFDLCRQRVETQDSLAKDESGNRL
jgi:hypothetical protein